MNVTDEFEEMIQRLFQEGRVEKNSTVEQVRKTKW